MEFKKSPLIFEDFAILESNLTTIMKENSKCDFDSIPLDIDFDLLINIKEEGFFNLMLKLKGNDVTEPLLGYKFSIIASGIFRLPNDVNDKDREQQFLLYSALPMLISSARNFLVNLTSYAPFGKYLLPAVDLKSLIETKASKMEKESN
ncbi:MAG: hypothetical protein PHR06_05480 [Candidatus Cloacimonetes bacterium]|nr:hypothetical protein [Candidatus Cloacimonadota bacterium]